MRTLPIAISLTVMATAFAQSLDVQLQRAVQKEVAGGDLKAAAEEYKKIAARAGVNHSIAAQALLHLAETYEKQGDAEARKTYERIVKEFGDQRDSANQANQRLAALTSGAMRDGIRLSQFYKPKNGEFDLINISADGRYAAATDYSGKAAVVDLAAGTTRNLTDYGTNEKGYIDQAVISRDGQRVAFWHYGSGVKQGELRVVDGDGKNERIVYSAKDDDEWDMPTDWSPDGRQIVMQIERGNKQSLVRGVTEFVLVPAAGGAPRVLKTAEYTRRYRSRILLSPNGRYVAYDYPATKDLAQGDIFVLPVDGGPEVAVAASPAQDTIVGWEADGESILFVSQRSVGTGLYRVAVHDGKQVGEPKLVRSEIGNVRPIGLSRTGSFFYSQSPSVMNAFVAGLDFATGRTLSAPARINESVVDSVSSPSWSVDGRTLAFVKWPGPAPTILIRPDGAGVERELLPRFRLAGAPLVWQPDGRSILAKGTKDDKTGIYRVDVTSGEATLVMEGVEIGEWSADGKLAFLTRSGGSIVRKDATGEEKFIYPGGARLIRISPDNRRLAFLQGRNTLMIIPADGGTATKLAPFGNDGGIGNYSWTPDGNNLLVAKGKDGKAELWIVPVNGGPARKTEMGVLDQPGVISIHPDGKRIAYSTRSVTIEYWALDNFLPAAK